MKKITIVLNDNVAATAWVELLKIGDFISCNIETVEAEHGKRRARATTGAQRRRDGVSAPSKIAEHFGFAPFTAQEAAAYLVGEGYNEKSAAPAVSNLKRAGFAKLEADGTIRVVKQVPKGHKF